jgi:hypothetical protein
MIWKNEPSQDCQGVHHGDRPIPVGAGRTFVSRHDLRQHRQKVVYQEDKSHLEHFFGVLLGSYQVESSRNLIR